MRFESGLKRSLGIFLFTLCLLVGGREGMSARVAGDEGATSVTEEKGEKLKAPDKEKPRLKTGFQGRAARREKKSVKKKAVKELKPVSKNGEDDGRYVTIDFDNVDIAVFIKFMSELTGKNFVIDKGVKGKITIISPTRISVEEAYRVFESVMEVHGYAMVPAGSIVKVVPAVQARSKDIETRLRGEAATGEDKVVTQLVPLRYADPAELKKLFTPLISKSSVIISYPPTGMLIITDVLSNIERLLRIVEVVDVEGIGEEISVVPLEYATASILAKAISPLFQMTRKKTRTASPVGPNIRIVADERTNVLVILASEDDTRRVKELIQLLDKQTPRGEGDIHVYYLQNANAEDLSKVLMSIPTKQKEGGARATAPVVSKEVQVVADAATNSLVITANRDDYLVLENVIKKLDIPRRMVYIEALIMEVSVTKEFDLGVQWQAADDIGSYDGRDIVGFGGATLATGISPSIDMTTGSVSLPTGLSLGVLGESISISGIEFPSIGALMRAYQGDSDVHILSTPQIMTTDNEEAEIQVGKNIPFLTSQDTSETGTDYSNYEFKDVGVTLIITPQINQERFVRLAISHELSQVVEQEVIGLPTTLKRMAKTTVIIKDGNTVVIGGLIDETMNDSVSMVPCLGGLPGLGWAFKATSRSGEKTNLFIFLTPHIVENPGEAEEIYLEKKEEIEKVEEGVIKMYKRRGVESP